MKNNFLTDTDTDNWNVGVDKEYDKISFGVLCLLGLVGAVLVFGFLFAGLFV